MILAPERAKLYLQQLFVILFLNVHNLNIILGIGI
jgi:hypothetical protein